MGRSPIVSNRSLRRAVVMAAWAAAAGTPAGRALATDGVWNLNGDGAWSNPLAWTGGVPSYEGDSATFGGVILANRTVMVGRPFTVGALTFNDDNRYTL